jgi:prepilin-type N-terminal cleavage/methylation domain-containing protein
MNSITGTSTAASKLSARVQRPGAFTLLELILVMAIIAVIVGLSVPSLHGFALGRRTTACADQIASLTQYAHTQAITRGMVYRLNIRQGTLNIPATYFLTVQLEDGTFGPTGDSFGLEFKAPDGVDISWNAPQQSDGQYIQFQPTGRTDPATIQVHGPDRKVILIGCPSATELYKVMTPEEARSVGM